MRGTAKMNALRSAVVVAAAVAFGYLTLQVGFKPFLEKAQLEQQRQEALQAASSQAQDSLDDGFPAAGATLADGLPESDWDVVQTPIWIDMKTTLWVFHLRSVMDLYDRSKENLFAFDTLAGIVYEDNSLYRRETYAALVQNFCFWRS